MTLRRRLIILVIVLATVVIGVSGAISHAGLRSELMSQIDANLHQTQEVLAGRGQGQNQGRGTGPGAQRNADRSPLDRPGLPLGTIAHIESGDRTDSGVVNGRFEVDPLTAEQTAQLLDIPTDGAVHTIEVEGLGSYRVVSEMGVQGRSVTGLPLERVEDTLRANLARQLALALSGLVVIAVVGTIAIRRELKPLGELTQTANRVSATPLDTGEVHLDFRSPVADPRTEVGQVGAALNTMLDHVEGSLAAREDSEKRARAFLADASHELRTPLASVAGYTELLQTRDLDPSEREAALGRIAAESKRMSGLVEDMLLLARLDAGRPLEIEPVALPVIVAEALMDAQAAAPDHTWHLDLADSSRSDFTVLANEDRLRQVVGNLLSNARLHTPAGTSVRVGIEERGGSVALTVADDGPGIPPEQLDHVFDRFSRGDASRRRASGTSGLGLPIAAAIVEAFGGDISVASDNGTTFTVTLPDADQR